MTRYMLNSHTQERKEIWFNTLQTISHMTVHAWVCEHVIYIHVCDLYCSAFVCARVCVCVCVVRAHIT